MRIHHRGAIGAFRPLPDFRPGRQALSVGEMDDLAFDPIVTIEIIRAGLGDALRFGSGSVFLYVEIGELIRRLEANGETSSIGLRNRSLPPGWM